MVAFWLSQLTFFVDHISDKILKAEATFKAKGIPIQQLLLKKQQQNSSSDGDIGAAKRFVNDLEAKAFDLYRTLLNWAYAVSHTLQRTRVLHIVLTFLTTRSCA